jgi:shikimate kinase
VIEKVLLIGMMGSGKSAVGAALATRLGWPYLDNDSLLMRTAGDTAVNILAQQGEDALRLAESRVLTVMLALPGQVLCGIPGGVVLDANDRKRMLGSGSHIVWLRASPPVLARRLGKGSGRPKLGDDLVGELRRLGSERNEFYAEVASQIIDVDALPVGAVAKAIIAMVEQPV